MAATRIWIKNPLAIFTANTLDAAGGLVIEDGVIIELLAAGQQPLRRRADPAAQGCRADHRASLLRRAAARLAPAGDAAATGCDARWRRRWR